MIEKINGKKKLLFHCFIVSLFLVLVYSRFVGLDWGLPYPMHPDERNMANALQQLQCKFPIISPSTSLMTSFQNCFNPHFFAYGQFPLYIGYLLIWVYKGFKNFGSLIIGFEEAVMSLRLISAVASIINVFILVKIINLILKKNETLLIILILTFSPFFIQFSHFGTTESLLMLFYSLIIYLSMQMLEFRTTAYEVIWLAMISGLTVATKVSSILFLTVPIIAFISKIKDQKLKLHIKIQKFLIFCFCFMLCILIFVIFFSPHNFINFKDFISSMNYESDVALGKSLVFYTRQFFNTVPVWFQLTKVFPYVLGWPVFILGGLGIIIMSWKDKKINLLRSAFLVYFIPSAMIYAKWSRFMAPIFPLLLIFAILFLFKLKYLLFNNNWINSKFKIQNSKVQVKSQKFFTFYFLVSFLTFTFLLLTCIIPGITYLSVYQSLDVRYKASEWIYMNIKNNNYLLFETANVVDIPIPNPKSKNLNPNINFQTISFNFYDLDINPELQTQLKNHIEKADYIFIPSRRIVANHTCQGNFQFSIFNFQPASQRGESNLTSKCQILKKTYPLLNQYYEDLFSGKLGFVKVVEFDSYPTIKFQISNFKFQIKFPDEQAEETWTVFDHPVIRIYKRIAGNPKL